MRERSVGTEHVHRSNARFVYQTQIFLHDVSTEAFSTETLMDSTPDKT
jgi:hypothetical protein